MVANASITLEIFLKPAFTGLESLFSGELLGFVPDLGLGQVSGLLNVKLDPFGEVLFHARVSGLPPPDLFDSVFPLHPPAYVLFGNV